MDSRPDLRDIEAVLFDFDGTLVHLNIDFGRMRAEVEALLPQYGLSMEGRSTLYVLELIEDATRELKVEDEGRAQAFQREKLRCTLKCRSCSAGCGNGGSE